MTSAPLPSPNPPAAHTVETTRGTQLVGTPLRRRVWVLPGLSCAGRRCLVDVVCIAVACVVAARSSEIGGAGAVAWSLAFAVILLRLLASRGLYQPRLDPRLLDTLRSVMTLTTVAAALVVTLRVFVGNADDVAAQAALLWASTTVLLLSARLSLAFAERRGSRAHGEPTLIVGAGMVGQAIARRLQAHKEFGLLPVGFLDKQPLMAEQPGSLELPVLGASWDFDDIVAAYGIRHVVVTFSTAPTEVFVRIMNRCEQLGIRTTFVPRFFEKTTERVVVDRLGALPLISSRPANPRGLQYEFKYALDVVGAALMILILSPVLAVIALCVLISSGRPILYARNGSAATESVSRCSSSVRCGRRRTARRRRVRRDRSRHRAGRRRGRRPADAARHLHAQDVAGRASAARERAAR